MDQTRITYKLLKPLEVPLYWQQIHDMLLPMMEYTYGELDLNRLFLRLACADELALCVYRGDNMCCVCIMGITDFETGKRVLQLPYIAGDGMDDWLRGGWDIMVGIAKDQGCTHIRGCGRKGWSRALPEFKPIRTIFEAEL